MPKGVREGIIRGIYPLKPSGKGDAKPAVHLLASGAILNRALEAQKILEGKYAVAADVWSVTSFKELHRDGLLTERWNMFHPDQQARVPYVSQVFHDAQGVFVAASDYVKTLPESISKWIPGRLISLGTDGFGRSDGRAHLRDFFEVDERYIALAALYGLTREGKIPVDFVIAAMKDLDIDPEKANPMVS
jgi:pyruvate dehydrogenase E1 component